MLPTEETIIHFNKSQTKQILKYFLKHQFPPFARVTLPFYNRITGQPGGGGGACL